MSSVCSSFSAAAIAAVVDNIDHEEMDFDNIPGEMPHFVDLGYCKSVEDFAAEPFED